MHTVRAAVRVLSPNLPTTAHAALETSAAAVVVVMPADKTTNQLIDEAMYSSDIINKV